MKPAGTERTAGACGTSMRPTGQRRITRPSERTTVWPDPRHKELNGEERPGAQCSVARQGAFCGRAAPRLASRQGGCLLRLVPELATPSAEARALRNPRYRAFLIADAHGGASSLPNHATPRRHHDGALVQT